MSEKNSILNLCVLIGLSDYQLENSETHEIIKISKEMRVEFNVHEAFEEISDKFREDFDSACIFYLKEITTTKFRDLAIECLTRVAFADGNYSDKEKSFIVLCNQEWGKKYFN
tara:strand:+ start:1189 stop:1527 length:339 start_codon:yes stop_codon:yes gene_type:complete